MDTLAAWLKTLTGLPAVALPPAAGAQGELCGIMTARACLEARGDARETVLVPESAHGTNPATAAACGYRVVEVASDAEGRVDVAALRARLGPDVAALMLTNPNTCGLFERDILEVAEAVHEAGGLFYCDGANFNAVMGRVRPADLGIDVMHLNLHKTFSTPHGGGGPGAGAGGHDVGARALRAPAVGDERTRRFPPARARGRRGGVDDRAAARLSWTVRDFRARPRLHDEHGRRRLATGGGRRGPERELRARGPRRRAERALGGAVHARSVVRRQRPQGRWW